MIQFYVMRLQEGKITLLEVPQLWRGEVIAELKKTDNNITI